MKNKYIFILYIVILTVGTVFHIIDIFHFGFLGYTFAPLVINIYWTSLTLFDFLTVTLIVRRIKWSVYFALAIIVSDVIINIAWGTYSVLNDIEFINWGLITQIPACIFIIKTYKKMKKYL
jgi:hypothetical protein